MFAVTKFSYTEVLFLKFALIRVENMVLVNRGFLYKSSTAVHKYMVQGLTQLFILLGSNCEIRMSSTELIVQYCH